MTNNVYIIFLIVCWVLCIFIHVQCELLSEQPIACHASVAMWSLEFGVAVELKRKENTILKIYDIYLVGSYPDYHIKHLIYHVYVWMLLASTYMCVIILPSHVTQAFQWYNQSH